MNVSEKVIKIDERRIKKRENDFLYNRYVLLQWEYFASFTTSGLLLLNHFGYLGWCTGIAWISISNIIAVLLVRIDVTINIGRLLECEKKKIDSFMSLSSLN